ncbi:hypothetical protein GCM10009865_54430 [Aeromicrobium ponti]|uniref:Uncharacterized protein n=1 Tax=Cytobacillus oceanisediminis TaxID=665099 RepID=A0A562J3R2_9BACI|nr:hypothetical protein [Cytobacillus oceanisediminis]TWH77859.1 hypothetical protein IQ19_05564 [Cytobacillus oceanisediminis]
MPSSKPSKRDLIRSFKNILTEANANKKMVGILRNNADDAAYEAYIFTLILKAIEKLSDDKKVRLKGVNETPKKKFIFRGNPGEIYTTTVNYGYAEFSYLGKLYEVHIDVQYLGTSKVRHEIDISILDKDAAQNCREKRISANARFLRIAFECKFYETLQIHLIRTFTGLLDDMGQTDFSCFLSNKSSENIQQFCTGKKNRPFFFPLVIPTEKEHELKFVNFIEVYIRKCFGKP